jgi:uncharacterized membrane protein YhdT
VEIINWAVALSLAIFVCWVVAYRLGDTSAWRQHVPHELVHAVYAHVIVYLIVETVFILLRGGFHC